MPNQPGPMACPVDGTALVMTERSGIEIDYCPTCRGVWLDRGELDKIIERNAASQVPQQSATPQPQGGVWIGNLGGKPFELRTRPEPGCSDGMSDNRYPIAVALSVGGEQRTGCAQPL